MTNNKLVSIIMPVYNDEQYLHSSIQSVLSQSYQDWELLIVDDCSTDSSVQIIRQYCQQDKRIRSYRTQHASGSPTKPRNIGVEYAQGRFIAFLDSDDEWLPEKLENQVALMLQKPDALIVFSNYKLMSEDGRQYRGFINAPSKTNYTHLLKGNVVGCLTVMYDTQKTGKCFFPSCGHEDYALWLSMLRGGGMVYNTNTIEAVYRLKSSSVSSNKFRAMGWQWHIYTKIERLGMLRSIYFFFNYAFRAVVKRKNLLYIAHSK